jgi:cell division septation protein DedD
VKERLTGAIILVALIVLLVPELLTGPVHSAPRAAATSSSVEEPPLRSYTIKLADEPHARGAGTHSGPEQPAPLPAAPAAGATSAPAPLAAEQAASASAPPSAVATSPPAHTPHPGPAAGAATLAPQAGSTETSGAYMVQLGSFASRANADRLAKQVRAQGFAVSVSQGSTGHLYRVRVGPAPDRSAAGELAQQLRAHGHSGAIVPQ